jgi:hypothetical protein
MNVLSEMMTKNTTAETVAQRKGNIMVSNIALNEDEAIITLKDLTDFIGVDHSKAMKKVEKLSEEPNFGLLAKMATINLNGLKVETYLLTKKQAIAVGAKLNNALLMKVIDKMEELEKERQSQTIQLPTNPMEILSLTYEALKNTNMELSEVKQDVELLKNDIVITPSQKRILGKTMKSKIMSFEPPSNLTGTLFKKGWSKLHDNFAVSSYMEIPRLRFDEAINIVNNLTLMDLVA